MFIEIKDFILLSKILIIIFFILGILNSILGQNVLVKMAR